MKLYYPKTNDKIISSKTNLPYEILSVHEDNYRETDRKKKIEKRCIEREKENLTILLS